MEKKSLIVCGYKKDKPEELVIRTGEAILPSYPGYSSDKLDDYYKAREAALLKATKEIAGDSMDVFGSEYHYGSYHCLAVAYVGDGDEDEILILQDEIADRLMEELVANSNKYMFIRDYSGKFARIEIPIWESRNEATSQQEAMQYLARAISQSFPLKISDQKRKEMEDYAAKFNIPLNVDLLNQAGNLFNLYDSPSWNSSSKYCWFKQKINGANMSITFDVFEKKLILSINNSKNWLDKRN